MVANKRASGSSSGEFVGDSDLAKVDAHVIQRHEYDEIPELTDEWFEQAVFSPGTGPSLPSSATTRADPHHTISLDPEIANRLRALGEGWQARANSILREWLDRQPA